MNNWSERMKQGLDRLIEQSEFGRLAKIVAVEIAEREPRYGEKRPEGRSHGGGLSVADIGRIVSTCFPHPINLYPGKPGDCHDVAMFFSLHGNMAYGSGHYTFEQILQTFVQHMSRCPITQSAVIITDSWWAPNYERWQKTIEQIVRKRPLHLEVYLIGPGWQTPVPV